MKRLFIFCSILLSYFLNTASAHPHSWVSLTSDFVVDTNGSFSELRQRWVFDPFYSALTVADLRSEFGDDIRLGLDLQGELIIDNLLAQQYFTHLLYNNEDRKLSRPIDHKLSLMSVGDDDILVLEMTFNLRELQLQADQNIGFSVYDPTYYVDMRHESVYFFRIHNQSQLECGFDLLDTAPTEEQIEYASSLDKTQTDTVGLGKIFAQHFEVTCL